MYETIIIGGGIAGLTSAIYASRKQMKYEIIATEFGGQFNVNGEILNYPGVVQTTGPDFVKTMQIQAEVNNIKVKNETVLNITKENKHFLVKTKKKTYKSKTVILASGARARKLNVNGEEEFFGKGVTYCSICDGPLFAGKDVAIIGGGNAALEAVDFMKKIAKKIHLIVYGDKLNAFEYLIDNVTKNKKVKIHYNADTTEISGNQFVESVTYTNTKTNKKSKIKAGGVIIEIGRIPNTEFVKNFVKLDKAGHIKIDCTTSTSTPGIFAAGDCSSAQEYQIVIAAGQGAMALIKASKYIANQNNKK